MKLINDLKSEVIEVKSIAEAIDVSKKSESEQNEVFNAKPERSHEPQGLGHQP